MRKWIGSVLLILLLGCSPRLSAQQASTSGIVYLKQVAAEIEAACFYPIEDDRLVAGAMAGLRRHFPSAGAAGNGWDGLDQAMAKVAKDTPDRLNQAGEAVVAGMLDSIGDPYSRFVPAVEEKDQSGLLTHGRFVGIGCELARRRGGLVIMATLDDSPARAAGLLSGDGILSIDGHTLSGLPLGEAEALLDGPAGQEVKLVVRRGGQNLSVGVRRAEVHFPGVRAVRYTTKPPVGYLRIGYFGETTGAEVGASLQTLQHKGISALVLDLRDNPGGVFHSGLEVAGMFVGKEPVLQEERRGHGAETISSVAPATHLDPWSIPIVILVNHGTASTSEILSAILCDRKHAHLVGTTTYGKDVILSLYKLRGGSAVWLSTGRVTTMAGRRWGETGLAPDVKAETRGDACIKAALTWIASHR